MVTLTLYNSKGKETGTLNVPATVFESPTSPKLLAQAVQVFLGNQRQGSKKTKTRGEVSFSTHKIWRQKGTGRARHGSKKAPIFVGGGVAHGPTGNENYTRTLSQKMRRAALKGSLTVKAKSNTIAALKDVADFKGKTSDLAKTLKAIYGTNANQKTLVILDKPYLEVVHAGQNIQNVTITQVSRLNTYEVLQHDALLITPEAIQYLDPTFKPETTTKAPTKKSTPSTSSSSADKKTKSE